MSKGRNDGMSMWGHVFMTLITCGLWLLYLYVRMLGRHVTRIG